MEQNDYLTLSEDGKKVKGSNDDYTENEEISNCVNKIRNSVITGCSNTTTYETSSMLISEIMNHHFSEIFANKYLDALSSLIIEESPYGEYGICVEGPNRSLFAEMILCGLNKQYHSPILQLFNDYQGFRWQIDYLFKKISNLNIYVVTVDKLNDGESLFDQIRNKLSELGFLKPNSYNDSSWIERIYSILLDSPDKRIVLYFADILTNQDKGRNIVEFQMLTEISNRIRIKIVTTYQRDQLSYNPSRQSLELIYNHRSDFKRIYV